jgi:hypothetical protein
MSDGFFCDGILRRMFSQEITFVHNPRLITLVAYLMLLNAY